MGDGTSMLRIVLVLGLALLAAGAMLVVSGTRNLDESSGERIRRRDP
jgi:hypothetical protein